ncbi:MAG: hypothetical protein ACFFD2_07020 [Promethearchaeota archaeon]
MDDSYHDELESYGRMRFQQKNCENGEVKWQQKPIKNLKKQEGIVVLESIN